MRSSTSPFFRFAWVISWSLPVFLLGAPIALGSDECTSSLTTNAGSHSVAPGDQSKITLFSGQSLNFTVETSGRCYWALFWKDSADDVFNISPNQLLTREGVYTAESRQYRLPTQPNENFTLDTYIGTELIVLVWSDQPLANMGDLGVEIAKSSVVTIGERLAQFRVSLLVQEIKHR